MYKQKIYLILCVLGLMVIASIFIIGRDFDSETKSKKTPVIVKNKQVDSETGISTTNTGSGGNKEKKISKQQISQENSETEDLIIGIRQATYKKSFKELEVLNPPIYLVLKEIANTQNDEDSRFFLADYLDSHHRKIDKDDVISNFELFESIIRDKNQKSAIRTNLISAITSPFSKAEKTEQEIILPLFLEIVHDDQDDSKVRAIVTQSLSWMKYEDIAEYLIDIVDNHEENTPMFVGGASLYLADLKNDNAITSLINLANTTTNEDNLGTAIYALSLTRSPRIIQPIINNCDKETMRIQMSCISALEKNKDILIGIVAEQNEEYLLPTIIALGKIQEIEALPYLEELLFSHPEFENEIKKSISEIKR